MTAKSSTRVDPLKLVTRLIDCGNVDTVYRDVYLGRGRTLLAKELPVEEFRRSEQQAAELATLAPPIGRAIEKGDWPEVKTLSDRAEALRRAVEGRRGQMETARNVYAVTDVKLDPFSPGLRAFTRLAEKDLLALRTRTVEHLTALALADAPWKTFYDDRRAALRALPLTASQRPETTAASADPRAAAERALKSGDMTGLAKLAGTLMAAVTPAKRAPGSSRPSARQDPTSEKPLADLLTITPTPLSRERGGSGWPLVVWSHGPSWPRSGSTPGIRCSRTSRDGSRSSSYPCPPVLPRPFGSAWRCS